MRVVLSFLAGCFLMGLLLTTQGASRPPVPPHVFKAVRSTPWKRPQRIQAFDIIACESNYNVWARNGQYLGMFQQGDWARDVYGFGWTARAQAWAAYRYWAEAGWSGWACAA